jgi:hypothetical protein
LPGAAADATPSIPARGLAAPAEPPRTNLFEGPTEFDQERERPRPILRVATPGNAAEAADGPPAEGETVARPAAGAEPPDPAETGTASTSDSSGFGPAAREMFLRHLSEPMDTIGVIGNYNVGKTFFIKRVIALAKRNGYSHEERELNPGSIGGNETQVGALTRPSNSKPRKGAPKESERLGATLNVWVHKFEGAEDSFRLIDMPGEFFLAALEDTKALKRTENNRVAMLYPALACSDALALIVPAHYAFGKSVAEKIEASSAVELLGSIRQISNLLEEVQKEGDLSAVQAVERVLAFSGEDLSAEITRRAAGRSAKPIAVLFSQADRCFGSGAARNPSGLDGSLPERDPLLCAARHIPELVNHLRRGFDDFRIDFLTAAEGQKEKDKQLRKDTPSIGVWPPITLLLERIAARRGQEQSGPLRALLRRWFLLDRLRDCERTSGWAVEIRAKADKEFRAALNR